MALQHLEWEEDSFPTALWTHRAEMRTRRLSTRKLLTTHRHRLVIWGECEVIYKLVVKCADYCFCDKSNKDSARNPRECHVENPRATMGIIYCWTPSNFKALALDCRECSRRRVNFYGAET